MSNLLILFSFIAFYLVGAQAQQNFTQCPPGTGGCNCICNCNTGGGNNGGNTCPPCPTITPTMMTMTPTMMTMTQTMGTTNGMGTTMGGNGTTQQPFNAQCFAMIRAAANADTGTLIGLLLTTVLQNLVMPILQIVLTGNNTLEGAVIPLANILCYIVGLLLLTLRSLGLLGLLGMGGLLQNILGGGIG